MDIITKARLVNVGIRKMKDTIQEIEGQLEEFSSTNDALMLLSSLYFEGDMFKLLLSPIEVLKLQPRSKNHLHNGGIEIVSQLICKTPEDLLSLRNFGDTSLKDVKEKLTENNLSLGMKFMIIPV